MFSNRNYYDEAMPESKYAKICVDDPINEEPAANMELDGDDHDASASRTPNSTPSANAVRLLKQMTFNKKSRSNAVPAEPTNWEQLPAELRYHIVTFFDANSLRAGSQVCREMNYFCTDEKLWQKRCQEEFGLVEKPSNRSWKWLYRVRSIPFQKDKKMTHGWMEIEDPKGLYFGEWSNDTFEGQGYFEWHQHGLRYAGAYVNGLRQGFGVLSWKNGDKYDGEFVADKKHGQGTFRWSNGDVYCGQYDADRKHGRGRITWGSHVGESYDGEWSEDKKQGYGKYIWSNGGSYEGNWLDNKRHGHGVERWPSGSIYDGEWVENDMHGWGMKQCSRDGRPDGFYEGPFQEGRAHGRGYRQYEDGSVFEGDYVADKRVGYGTYTWKDGEKFSGTWAVGREKGFFYAADGTVYYQEWFEDKLREDRRTGAELYQVPSSTGNRLTE